ncbi:MAG: hypothetical protein KF697_10665 [Pseudolabrys sp.]|nr:hypothetical protein [Pseudolabrys sp.]
MNAFIRPLVFGLKRDRLLVLAALISVAGMLRLRPFEHFVVERSRPRSSVR